MSPSLTSTNKADERTIYFWRETEETYGFLSQWYTAPFEAPASFVTKSAECMTFLTTEQWMMYQKAVTFGDEDIAAKIMKESSPRKHRSLGRKVANFDNKVWDNVKEQIVEEGNYWKFTNGKVNAEKMRKALLETGERQLVEASPFDRIWGIGYNASNASSNSDWGLNLLGKALMRVRKRLQEEKSEVQATDDELTA